MTPPPNRHAILLWGCRPCGETWEAQTTGGAGLDEVRRMLGHEGLTTTLRYSKPGGSRSPACPPTRRRHRAAAVRPSEDGTVSAMRVRRRPIMHDGHVRTIITRAVDPDTPITRTAVRDAMMPRLVDAVIVVAAGLMLGLLIAILMSGAIPAMP